MKTDKLKWYYRPLTINILIVAGIFTFLITTIIAMVLVYLRSAEIDKKRKQLIVEIKKNEEKNEAIERKMQEGLKKEYEKYENSLHVLAENYIDENYIERRDAVLLEQLAYTPIECRYNVSGEYKEKIKELETKEKELIKTNDYVLGSLSSKKAEEAKIEKIVIAGINAITDTEISQVSIKSFKTKKKKISKTIDQFNDGLKLIHANLRINPEIVKLKQQKLELMLEYKTKVEEEKELIKEAREREKEEKKLNAILEKEIGKIEKEKQKLALQKEVYFTRVADEKNEDMKKAILIEIEKINLAEKDLNDSEKSLAEKKKLTGAGYVYVISNIGSFGEGVYKIGMTRRQEPLERVKELGNASVPFLFDVHALIYSKNAYELEHQLHKEFEARRVNKVNCRKEFFKVSLAEIQEVVLAKYNGTVDFIQTPEAIEYRETLLLEEKS